jgi:hypothetical protein
VLLVIVAVPLALFYRELLAEAWTVAERTPVREYDRRTPT